MFVFIVPLNGEDQGQGNRSPDGSGGADYREFIVGNFPLHAEFEDKGESEYGYEPGKEADDDFSCNEGDGVHFVEIVDERESEVDEYYGFCEEGDELEGDPDGKGMSTWSSACLRG